MSVSISDSGTQTTSGTTDHTLSTRTTPGTYVLVVDLNSMAIGDIVELSIYVKPLVGGTSRLAYHASFGPGIPAEPIVFSVPVPITEEMICKLKKAAGANSGFPWAVLLL